MPNNFGSSDSKWSGERERKERDRQRDAQKELMRQARIEREANEAREAREADARAAAAAAIPPSTADQGSEALTPRRRLSASEREVIRKLQGEEPDDSSSPGSDGPPVAATGRARVGRRWRSAVEETSASSQLALPNLPGDQKRRTSISSGRGFTSSRLLIFGAILFVAMAAVAFLPFGPFGGGGNNPTPTPTQDVPIISPNGTFVANSTPQAKVTAVSDKNTVVCIDPGHGGWDYGFQRTWPDSTTQAPVLNESELNLGMAYMLKERLESQGITVVMTRAGGEAVNIYGADVNDDGKTIFDGDTEAARRQNGDYDELQARIDVCNKANADILISLHINGAQGIADARGYEVLYTAYPTRPFGDLSAAFANDVYRRISQGMNDSGYTAPGRNVKTDDDLQAEKYSYGSQEHLLLTGPAVDKGGRKLVPSNMPAIICEPVFLSNVEDAGFIADPKNQKMLVDAYADGIRDYFAKNPG
jgi:N-acetylmuramoyl-L-alanine amidase